MLYTEFLFNYNLLPSILCSYNKFFLYYYAFLFFYEYLLIKFAFFILIYSLYLYKVNSGDKFIYIECWIQQLLVLSHLYLFTLLLILIFYSTFDTSTNIDIIFCYDVLKWNQVVFNFKFFLIIINFLFAILLIHYIYYFLLISFEYLILLIFFFAVAGFIFSLNNLFLVFICLEFLNLILYNLINSKTGFSISLQTSELSLKYCVFNGVSTILLGWGLSLLYSLLLNVNLSYLQYYLIYAKKLSFFPYYFLSNYWLLSWVLILLLLSFLFKLGLFPFHYWAVEIYSNCHFITLILLLIVVKLPIFYLVIQVVLTAKLLVNSNVIYYILELVGWLSILVGNLSAIRQVYLKRLFVFSSLVHWGYIIFFLSFIIKFESLYLSLNYFFVYIFVIYLVLTLLIFLISRQISFDENLSINRLELLYYFYPKWSILFLILLLCLSNLPFFIFFFFKFKFFLTLSTLSLLYYSFLIGSLLFVIFLNLYYYFKIIKVLFFKINIANKKLTFKQFLNDNLMLKNSIDLYLYSYLFLSIFLIFYFILSIDLTFMGSNVICMPENV